MKSLTKPVIIIGTGRTGTTIISEILFRHEALGWPSNYSERFPSTPAVNLFRRLFENKIWHLEGQKPQLNKISKINKILFKPSEAYNLWEYLTGPRIDFSRGFLIDETATPPEAEKIRYAFRKMLLYQGKERLAFKITGPSRIGYLQSIFEEPVFINIVRDVVPTIRSLMRVGFWQINGLHKLWWTGAYTRVEQEWAVKNAPRGDLLTAFQFKRVRDVTDMEISKHHANCLTIRYEDFVTNPTAAISQMLDFAGLPPSRYIDEYLKHIKVYNRNERLQKKESEIFAPEVYQILQGEFDTGMYTGIARDNTR